MVSGIGKSAACPARFGGRSIVVYGPHEGVIDGSEGARHRPPTRLGHQVARASSLKLMGSEEPAPERTASDLRKHGYFEAVMLDFGRRVCPGRTIKARRAC
jgi:hypothetical protein